MTTLVMNFGRFQGPHKGHQMLADYMKRLASENNGDYMIFPSSTHNAKNPIPFNQKVEILKGLMPEHSDHISDAHPNSVVKILTLLQDKYDNIIFVCGSDQVRNFSMFLPNYNDIEYSFKSITVVAAGDDRTDNDGNDVASCSATRMRQFVLNNDMTSFIRHVPETAPAINIEKAFAVMRTFLVVSDDIVC